MYYVYDDMGYFVAKLISFTWAKKLANAYGGYVQVDDDEFGGRYLVYDSEVDYYYEYI